MYPHAQIHHPYTRSVAIKKHVFPQKMKKNPEKIGKNRKCQNSLKSPQKHPKNAQKCEKTSEIT